MFWAVMGNPALAAQVREPSLAFETCRCASEENHCPGL